MESERECYELALTPNYVSDWTFNDAIRELIQNGTDQEILDSENKFSINYDSQKRILRLLNTKSSLKINTLLLGRSSKSNNDDTVGQFGEGYKIAALVINRIGKTFTIYNNEKNEIWESRFKNSEKWREKILAFYIRKEITDKRGLCVEIGNVSTDEYTGFRNVWIEMNGYYEKIDTLYGQILTEEEFSGEIYVNGLYVGENQDMRYGYNIKPNYIQLERDRKTCSSWDLGQVTSLMIADAIVSGEISISEVQEMLQSSTGEVYHLEFNTYKNNVKELQNMLWDRFNEQNPNPVSIPVSTEEDARKARAYGGKPIAVPSKVMKLIADKKEERMKEIMFAPSSNVLTLRQKFNRWYDIYSLNLPDDCREEIRVLIDEVE